MNQEGINEPGNPFKRFLIAYRYRFLRVIRACHYKGIEIPVKQKMMKRRVSQHEPEIFVIRGKYVRQSAVSCLMKQHDRTSITPEKVRLGRRDPAISFDDVDTLGHQCERLLRSSFSSSQLLNGPLVGRVDSKMKPSNAAHGHDLALLEQINGALNWIFD
jgi:hypothetical protein